MTRLAIIEKIVLEPNFRNVALSVMEHWDHGEDILQDLALQIMEMSDERIAGIRNPRAYCISYVWQQYNSITSQCYKKYKQKGVMVEIADFRTDIDEDIPLEEYDSTKDDQLRMIDEILDSMTAVQGTSEWYEAELFLGYLREGSYKRLSEKSGIHYRSVRNTVKECKQKLIEQVNQKTA